MRRVAVTLGVVAVLVAHVLLVTAGARVAVVWLGGAGAVGLVAVVLAAHVAGFRRLADTRWRRRP